MLKSRCLLVTFVILYLSTYSNCEEDILLQIKDTFREPLIDLRASSTQSHIHLDLQNLVKKIEQSRLLQQQNPDINNYSDNSDSSAPKWKSNLSDAERESYKKMINLKISFAVSLPYLPQNFEPENPQYLEKVFQIMINFFYFVGSIAFLIIIYLVLRFCCKKCQGPIKMSQITRTYRNFTWVVLISSIIAIITIFGVILSYSFKINSGINNVTRKIQESSNVIYNKHLNSINQLVKNLEAKSTNLPDVPLKLTKENLEAINSGIKTFNKNTNDRLETLTKWENRRNLFIIITFVFYLLIAALSFLGFRKRWPGFLLTLSIVLLISLPFLVAFGGLMASHYFVYADFCDSVYNAIYDNHFPISDKRIGFYLSCFNTKTKSAIYSFKWELESYEYQLNQKYGDTSSSVGETETYTKIVEEINNVRENNLKNLIECTHVYENLLNSEEMFCKTGMNWTYSLFTSMSWLFLIILLCSYAVNRLKPLVEKRKNEIESMLNNEQPMY